MGLTNISTLTIILVILMSSLALATHIPQISLTPSELEASTDTEMKLKVVNEQGDNIVKVSVLIPENEGGPYFKIKEIASPAGWTYQVRYKLGQTYPYKITWLTEGAGIVENRSQEFSFTVETPPNPGDYTWIWKTEDSEGEVISGSLVISIISKKLASFEMTEEPESVKAGESFKVRITAKDNLGETKQDYVGIIYFESTDPKALLPEKYNFTLRDRGSKIFELEFRTYGNQTLSVIDKEKNISGISDKIFVGLAELVSLSIFPENPKIEPNETLSFQTFLTDVYGNRLNVTDQTTFSIEEEAGGEFVNNTYKTENEGLWVVKASYENLTTGTLLEVVSKLIQPEVNLTINVTKPEVNVTKPQPRMEIGYPTSVDIKAGEKITFNISIKNTGNVNLTKVKINIDGIPQEWVNITPEQLDIEVNKSQKYNLIISIPENQSGKKIISLIANSTEGISTSGALIINISKKEEIALPSDYILEIIIITGVAIVLIALANIFLRRKKKEEKPR